MEETPSPIRSAFVVLVLATVFAVVAARAGKDGRVGLHREDGRVITMQDFGVHLRFVRTVWSGAAGDAPGSVYSVGFHRNIIRGWSGEEEAEWTLPFGYSPTMLWLLAPLASLPVSVAYLLWTVLGLAAAVWLVLHRRTQTEMSLAALLSPVALGAIAVGQTVFLTTLAILVLMDRSLRPRSALRRRDLLVCTVLLWALTAKPPLALTAGAALWALGRRRPVVGAVALAAVGAAALTPWLGAAWPGDYVQLLSAYDTGQADPLFAGSLRSSVLSMTNLRAFLHLDAGLADKVVARGATVAWTAALAALVAAGRRRVADGRLVWALAVLAYLLLCPHVSFTEDLHLLLVPAVLVPWTEVTERSLRSVVPWLLVPLALVTTTGVGPLSDLRPAPLLLFKLLFVCWVMWAMPESGESEQRASGSGGPFP